MNHVLPTIVCLLHLINAKEQALLDGDILARDSVVLEKVTHNLYQPLLNFHLNVTCHLQVFLSDPQIGHLLREAFLSILHHCFLHLLGLVSFSLLFYLRAGRLLRFLLRLLLLLLLLVI